MPFPQMEDVAEAEAALIEREVTVEAARRAAAEDAAAAKAASEQLAAERSAVQEADSGAHCAKLARKRHDVVPLQFCLFTPTFAHRFTVASASSHK